MPDVYSHGHHESVLRSHTWRTAENSAAYLLPSLEAGQALLDVGCGPGTITVDLARLVAPGEVIGIDREPGVLAQARARAADQRATAVTFQTGDVYALDFPDGHFDVVHAHQVLQHLTDPVAALREMRRVARPGGIVAVRESDYATFTWAPEDERLTRWLELYHRLTRRNGAQADAGRHLLGWAQEAGFTDISVGASAWTFADPESRRWWGGLWADRILQSAFAEQVIDYGLAERAELEEYAAAWRHWIDQPDGFFAHLNGELLARR
jgi:ubiquinone/menaquinone biosynthesis C-methylase UbiE